MFLIPTTTQTERYVIFVTSRIIILFHIKTFGFSRNNIISTFIIKSYKMNTIVNRIIIIAKISNAIRVLALNYCSKCLTLDSPIQFLFTKNFF